jgi:hypothetical protein
MATNDERGATGGPGGGSSASAGGPNIRDVLSEDDRNMLRLWRDGLSVVDPRYHMKGVLQLANHAMVDEQFRTRLVNDTDALLREVEPKLEPVPEGVTLRFFANTPDTLNVVLPPMIGEMDKRPAALRELLRSRTSEAVAFGGDDFDFGNFFDSGPAPGHADGGDPHTADGSIFVTA